MDFKLIHTVVFDFDGVFTDNHVYVDENGVEMVRCNRADGLGLDMLKKAIHAEQIALDLFILSTEVNPVVSSRAKKMKLQCIQGCSDKLNALTHYLEDKFSNLSQGFQGVVYLGNDINDLEVMKVCGYSFAPCDAHPAIKHVATNVLNSKGGHGFVREFVELYCLPKMVGLSEYYN